MKRILLIIILSIASWGVRAQCTIDARDFTVCTSCTYGYGADIWGQTFKACSDGTLGSIAVVPYKGVTTSDGVDLQIYSRNPLTGTLLGTIEDITLSEWSSLAIPLSSTDYSTIDVSSLAISVETGDEYSFKFVNSGVKLIFDTK